MKRRTIRVNLQASRDDLDTIRRLWDLSIGDLAVVTQAYRIGLEILLRGPDQHATTPGKRKAQ